MSFDRDHGPDDIGSAVGRPLRAAPGLDRSWEPGGRIETAARSGTRDREIGELASENADLYRRNAEQGRTIEQLQARVDMSEARFRTWAKEMANREDARAVRDEARDKREMALTARIAELERRPAEPSDIIDRRGTERHLGGDETARTECGQRERGRARPSNEFIGIGVAVGVAAGTVAADPTPVNFIIGALGVAGAGIPWIRKLREAGDGDRPRG